MSDFSFNGQWANEFGALVKTTKRPILPSIRQEYESIPGRHGTYDFSDRTLEDRLMEVDCSLIASSVADLRTKARQIASWLYRTQKSQIIFADETDKYYLGKVTNQIEVEQMATIGEFTLQFRCDPFAFSVQEKTAQKPSGTSSITVNNNGSYECLPILIITATGAALTNPLVTIGDKTIKWTGTLNIGESLTLDCEKITAKKGSLNAMVGVSGEFPVLKVSTNSISMSSENSTTSGTLEIRYRERWL